MQDRTKHLIAGWSAIAVVAVALAAHSMQTRNQAERGAIVAAARTHAADRPVAKSAAAVAVAPTRAPQIVALVHSYDGAQALIGPGEFGYTGGVLTLTMTPRSTVGIFRGGFERR